MLWTLEVEVLDLPISNNFCIWTLKQFNNHSMLYKALEYDESVFLKHKFEKINMIWFINFLLWTFK
jgi:hypothetical protein